MKKKKKLTLILFYHFNIFPFLLMNNITEKTLLTWHAGKITITF